MESSITTKQGKQFSMRTFNKVILVAALCAATTAQAAQDGTLGASSTGVTDITLVKDNAVQISAVNDINLGTYSSTATTIEASDDLCVFNSTASYNVTVTTANGSFELSNGTQTIPYSLSWSDLNNTDLAVFYSIPLTGRTGDRTSPTCDGGTNTTVAVRVDAAAFNNAVPGTYTDTVTMMIQPE